LMDLMADTIDGLESLGHINTAAAETVELDTSREDVLVLGKRRLNSVGEGTLKGKSTVDLSVALVLVGLASGIIAAHTSAVISRARGDARSIAVARLVASLADTHVKELVGKRLGNNLADEGINAKTDLLLVLESLVVLSSRIALIVVLGKSVSNEELRNSGLVLKKIHLLLAGSSITARHESSPGHVLEAEVTILARAGGALLGGIVVRILKDGAKVNILTVVVDGLDPAMGPARGDIGVELGILKASIRRGRGRSRGCNVDVLRELLLVEHGARVAGRHEEDELLEHLLAGHGIKNSGEIVVVEELLGGHGNDTRVTVVIVEDENVIVLGGLKGLATASSSGIARKNVDKVLHGSILRDVILDDTLINIDVLTTRLIELVENLTRERILTVVGDIILEESDNVLVRDTSLVSKLICLVDRGLVTIVTPATATSNKNNPGVTTLLLTGLHSLIEKIVLLVGESESNDCKNSKDCLHYVF